MITLHGYTLGRIHGLACASVGANYTKAADYIDLYAAAHGAMVDLLLTADAAPEPRDLALAGKSAIRDLVNDYRHTHGLALGPTRAPRFTAYWSDRLTAVPSHEGRIVEHLALAQVLLQLRPIDRDALVAHAACGGDRDTAATALRIGRHTYDVRLLTARRRALVLWHDSETPRRPHYDHSDRRRHRGDLNPCGTLAACQRHRRKREPLCELCAPVEAAYDRDRKARRRVAVA